MRRYLIKTKDKEQYVGTNDSLTDTRASAQCFDSILSADTHAAYLSRVYGVDFIVVGEIK